MSGIVNASLGSPWQCDLKTTTISMHLSFLSSHLSFLSSQYLYALFLFWIANLTAASLSILSSELTLFNQSQSVETNVVNKI